MTRGRFRPRQLAKEWLRRLGYAVRREPQVLLDQPDARFQVRLSDLVPALFEDPSAVTFVQIGANDGMRADPLHDLVTRFRWRGVLLEPQRDMFVRLQRTYSDSPQLTLLNVAVAQAPGVRVLYSVRPDPGLPEWASGIASFDRETLLSHRAWIPHLDRLIVERHVECVTLEEALRRGGLVTCDIVQIDAEGFDGEVVRMIDLSVHKPRLINYETKHLKTADANRTAEYLVSHGYRLLLSGNDTTAVHRP